MRAGVEAFCVGLGQGSEPVEIGLKLSAEDWAKNEPEESDRPVEGEVDVVGELASGGIECDDLAAAFDLSGGSAANESR